MDRDTILDRLLDQAPFATLIRGSLDWFFDPAFLNLLAEEAFHTNYTWRIHFADLVRLLIPVVFQPGRSVRSAYRGDPGLAAVAALSSFYAKLNGLDPGVGRQLVRRTAERAAAVAAGWPARADEPLPGLRVLTLDGNHLAATDRRLDGLSACTALPGLGLVIREYATGLFADFLPIPDAYARELTHAPDLLRGVLRADDCVVADREFCADGVLAAVAAAGAFFVVRHRRTVTLHPLGDPVRRDVSPDRTVWEYAVRYGSTDRVYRCIRVDLGRPTQDGDTQIHLLTNLPEGRGGAAAVAGVYHGRRAIETAFHELAMALHGEVRTLAYPPAALLCFGLAAAVYNLLQVARRAVAAEHDRAAADRLSAQLLCEEVSLHLPTLLVLLREGDAGPQPHWGVERMRGWMRQVVRRMDLRKYQRSRPHPPGSAAKRPRAKGLHESTQRLLDTRKSKKRVGHSP